MKGLLIRALCLVLDGALVGVGASLIVRAQIGMDYAAGAATVAIGVTWGRDDLRKLVDFVRLTR